jgi:hypothetical protein
MKSSPALCCAGIINSELSNGLLFKRAQREMHLSVGLVMLRDQLRVRHCSYPAPESIIHLQEFDHYR